MLTSVGRNDDAGLTSPLHSRNRIKGKRRDPETPKTLIVTKLTLNLSSDYRSVLITWSDMEIDEMYS